MAEQEPNQNAVVAPKVVPNVGNEIQLSIDKVRVQIRPNKRLKETFAHFKPRHPGRRHVVDWYAPDDLDEDGALVFTVAMDHASRHSLPKTTASLFASAMCALVPELLPVFEECMTINNLRKVVSRLPSQADERVIDVDVEPLEANQIVYLFGLCFLMLFKNLSTDNFHRYFDSWRKALGGRLQMTPKTITDTPFPFNLEQALQIKSVFGFNSFKQNMLQFMMRATHSGGYMKDMAEYCCAITAWNEMTVYALVFNVFCKCKSPVFTHLAVQSEWSLFCETMAAIVTSDKPEYFPYFCNPTQQQLLSRHRIPILAAVAQKYQSELSGSTSPGNFKRTLSNSGGLVDTLLNLHKRHVNGYRAQQDQP